MSDADRIASPGEINGDVVDRFTLAHGAAGVLAGSVGVGPLGALALAVGWEIVERPLKRALPGAFPNATQDTWGNMVGDVGAFMIGWFIANRLR